MELPFPTVEFEDELDFFLLELDIQDRLYSAGVVSEGEAAQYALVWEWGNVRQTQIGPKTTLGMNPNGEQVFLSIQAPYGYIRINELRYMIAAEQELRDTDLKGNTSSGVGDALKKCARRISKKMVEITQETVPIDSGALHRSLQPLDPDDDIADEVEDGYETMVFD